MEPTGTLTDDGTTLVLSRTVSAPITEVWAAATESDLLGQWFATWEGDPADGFVLLSMTAEAESGPPVRCDITECIAPTRLVVATVNDWGSWNLAIDLTEADGEAAGTTILFCHRDLEAGTVGSIGPGWEWYLDRLVALLDGTPLPSLEAFDDYMTSSDAYTAMATTE